MENYEVIRDDIGQGKFSYLIILKVAMVRFAW